ncbi:hypothetical protein JCM10212_006429 [Sporobolomyces blumeae]
MARPLSQDLVTTQLEALDLCESLFPLPGEIVLDPSSARSIPTLREWLERGTTSDKGESTSASSEPQCENELRFTINLSFERPEVDDPTTFPLTLAVTLPLTTPNARIASYASSSSTIRLQQPPWLSRGAYDDLVQSLATVVVDPSVGSSADLILQTVDYVREHVLNHLPTATSPSSSSDPTASRRIPSTGWSVDPDAPEYRVWLWFPSLSTREKRDDIVNWAPDYGLTGFVLAGKPAILCLEGTEDNIQAYMAEIKSKSWADIPSFQKKVSERFRTRLALPRRDPSPSSPMPPSSTRQSKPSSTGGGAGGASSRAGLDDDDDRDPTSVRIFTSMAEITSLIPRGGARGNRGSMVDVRDYLEAKGLGAAFGAVVGGGQF